MYFTLVTTMQGQWSGITKKHQSLVSKPNLKNSLVGFMCSLLEIPCIFLCFLQAGDMHSMGSLRVYPDFHLFFFPISNLLLVSQNHGSWVALKGTVGRFQCWAHCPTNCGSYGYPLSELAVSSLRALVAPVMSHGLFHSAMLSTVTIVETK